MSSLSFELFENPIWLAPMAGVTDKAFRTLCVEHGAKVTYTEMVSAKALEYDNARTKVLTEPAPAEGRIAVQLFGHEPLVMAQQAKLLAQDMGERLLLIDVNMGCPVPKVTKKGEGSALMKTPELAAEMIARMVEALDPLNIPVTAKFRSGWSKLDINAVEFAEALEDAGAAALSVHGRTATQKYTGNADWQIIKAVKDAVNVPVIGSGDVMSSADAQRMLDECGVDAVFAARGARGNPWIFEGRTPSNLERLEAAQRHLELYVEFYGDEYLSPLRTQLSFYIRGQAGATDIRRTLGDAQTYQDYLDVFENARQRL